MTRFLVTLFTAVNYVTKFKPFGPINTGKNDAISSNDVCDKRSDD